jgi:hypothetical protein
MAMMATQTQHCKNRSRRRRECKKDVFKFYPNLDSDVTAILKRHILPTVNGACNQAYSSGCT